MPNLVAYDLAGVQPMSGPTGLIFAMRSKYTIRVDPETFYDEADTAFSGQNEGFDLTNGMTDGACWYGYYLTRSGTNPGALNPSTNTTQKAYSCWSGYENR